MRTTKLLLLLLLFNTASVGAKQSDPSVRNQSASANVSTQDKSALSKVSAKLVPGNNGSTGSKFESQVYTDEKNVPFLQWRLLAARKTDELMKTIQHFRLERMAPDARFFWQGTAYGAHGDIEQSVGCYDRIKDYSKMSNFALDTMLKAYRETSNNKKLLELTQIEINRNTLTENMYKYRSEALINLGRFEEAAVFLKTGVSAVAPERKGFMLQKAAEAYNKMQNYEAATNCLSDAIKLRTANARDTTRFYVFRGNILKTQKKYELAIKDFSTVLALIQSRRASGKAANTDDWAESNALLDRAKCYDLLGKHDLAAQDYAAHKKISRSIENDFLGQ